MIICRMSRICCFASAIVVVGMATSLGSVRVIAQEAAPPAGSVAHATRPTIAVIGVGDIDNAGHVTNPNGQGNMVTLALAEKAITDSHAFQLYGRDLLAQQNKEIKLDKDGYVIPSTAQDFGKSVGIQRFLVAFVSNGSTRRFTGLDVYDNQVPLNGEPVKGKQDIQSPDSTTPTGPTTTTDKKGHKTTTPAPVRRDFIQSTVSLMCRFTGVETGSRQTEQFEGIATADSGHGQEAHVVAAAVQDAFDNFRKGLEDKRTLLVANVMEVAENKAVVDMGTSEGIVKDMAFEVCEVKKIGSFTSYEHVCDARVKDVSDMQSLLDLGEYHKSNIPFVKSSWQFSQKDDKAKLVQKGMVVREKKF